MQLTVERVVAFLHRCGQIDRNPLQQFRLTLGQMPRPPLRQQPSHVLQKLLQRAGIQLRHALQHVVRFQFGYHLHACRVNADRAHSFEQNSRL